MPDLKVAIELRSLRQPFKQALHTAARLGATGVEIDAREDIKPQEFSQTARRQLRKMLEDLGLKVAALSFHTRRGYNVADDLDRRVAATKAALDFAYSLGASVVVNHVGRVPEEPNTEGWDLLVDVLRDLGNYSQRAGAWLAAQTGSESAADLKRLFDVLPEGSVGIDLDPGNMIINGYNPAEVIEQLGQHIIYVHARDGVRDPGRRRGLEVPLGRGSADFPQLLGMLEEREYRGWFSIMRQRSEDPLTEIGAAVQYLKNL